MRFPTILSLLAIEGMAIMSMWGSMYLNGYADALKEITEVGPQLLPLTNVPLMTEYVGFEPLDKFLTILQLFFANVADGRREGGSLVLKLFVMQFVGTLGAVVIVMGVEGAKRGGTLLDMGLVCLTGICIQAFGYGIAMPIYCAFNLLLWTRTTPVVPFSQATISSMKSLPFSLIGGYIVPTLLMVMPTRSPIRHQQFVALWQFFPLWMFIAQFAYSRLYLLTTGWLNSGEPAPAAAGAAAASDEKQTVMESTTQARDTIGEVYLFTVMISALSHWGSLVLTFGPQLAPALFPADVVRNTRFTFAEVFVPPSPLSEAKIADITQGPLIFLQWDEYVGSLAVGLWAFALRTMEAGPNYMAFVQLAKMAIATVLLGPGAAIVLTMWAKDDASLELIEAGSQKKVQ